MWSVTYSTDRENEGSKIFIISLGSKRWRRFQSSGTAIDDWRVSNPKHKFIGFLKKRLESKCSFKLQSNTFPLNKFQSFLQETFARRLKQTFEFSRLYIRVLPTKLTKHSTRTNWENLGIICGLLVFLFEVLAKKMWLFHVAIDKWAPV